MTIFSASEVSGFNVPMKTTNTRHINPKFENLTKSQLQETSEGKSFSELLRNAFYDVNSIELRKDNMMQQFITDPNSVEIHDLTNAMAKAELSLGFVRSVTDKVVSAYREISNIR